MGLGGRRGWLGLAALALVLASCAALGPSERVVEAPSLLTTGPTSGTQIDGEGAVLRPPVPARTRPRPVDESCPALATPGFTARCGVARTKDGPVVWLAEVRSTGRGVRAQVLRETPAGELAVLLEAVDEDGSRFDDVRGAVADVSGDGSDDIAISFYRRGSQQVLAIDLVEAPGVVAVHRDWVQGSARAVTGVLEGWEAVGGALVHERIRFEGGSWQRTVTSTAAGSAVHGQDFADPFVLRAGHRYYGYSTNRGAANVPVVTSTDLHSWSSLADALPRLPAWSNRGRVWAPSVLARQDGYVLYYTTREVASGVQCISRASAARPEGPFADDSAGPLVCQQALGGSIDPSPFVDRDGAPYLTWKSEGWGNGEAARLWSQPLSADGLAVTGTPSELLVQDREWELPTIEGPALVADGDRLYLFYSAGRWQNTTYAVGWASCETALGPCAKAGADAPLLASAADRTGPGGPGGTEVVVDPAGGRWLAFHAWVPHEGGYPAGRRMLHVTPLQFEAGLPVLGAREVGT